MIGIGDYMKYRRISDEICAFQYDGDLKNSDGQYIVPDWAAKAFESGKLCYMSINGEPPELFLRSEKSCMGENFEKVNVGDYLTITYFGTIVAYNEELFKSAFEPV